MREGVGIACSDNTMSKGQRKKSVFEELQIVQSWGDKQRVALYMTSRLHFILEVI